MSHFILPELMKKTTLLPSASALRNQKLIYKFTACLVLCLMMTGFASATEGKGSAYPTGVETIVPAMIPTYKATTFMNFNSLYVSNTVAGATGLSAVPGYHLRVMAIASKTAHNWGVPVLGGELFNQVAVPFIYTHLELPTGEHDKFGVGNPNIETGVVYQTGSFRWWYGFELYTPGPSYTKSDVVNIGQHNFATAPAGAISYHPFHGNTLVNAKYQYITNYSNNTTKYHSGQQSILEYSVLQALSKRTLLGANGYYYQQTTNDTKAGAVFNAGLRGRNASIGPEVRCRFNHLLATVKWESEFKTENAPHGNSFWLQLAVPLSHSPSHSR
jgi:hypothetical protein